MSAPQVTHSNMGLLENTLVIGGLWAAGHALLGWTELRLHWPKNPRLACPRKAWLSRNLFRLSRAFPLLWALGTCAFAPSPLLTKPQVFGFLVFAMVFHGLTGVWRGLEQRRAAGDTNRANLRAAVWRESRYAYFWLGVLGAASLLWMSYGSVSYWSLPLLWFGKKYVNEVRMRRRRGQLVLEESPLKTEISVLGRRFGFYPDEVQVYRARTELGVPLFFRLKSKVREKQDLLIPLANFQTLNPSTLTAALCVQWAKHVRSGSSAADLNGQSVGAHLMFGCGMGFVSFAGLMIALGVTEQLCRNAKLDYWLGVGLVGLVFSVVVGSIAREGGWLPLSREALRDAFYVWSQGDTDEERTVEDFARAYAEYHAFVHAIRDPRLLEYSLRLDSAFVALLEESGVTDTLNEIHL